MLPIYITNKAKQIASNKKIIFFKKVLSIRRNSRYIIQLKQINNCLTKQQAKELLGAYEFERTIAKQVSNVRKEATLISRRKNYGNGSTTQSYSNEL